MIKAFDLVYSKNMPLGIILDIGPSQIWPLTSVAAISQNGRQKIYIVQYLSL